MKCITLYPVLVFFLLNEQKQKCENGDQSVKRTFYLDVLDAIALSPINIIISVSCVLLRIRYLSFLVKNCTRTTDFCCQPNAKRSVTTDDQHTHNNSEFQFDLDAQILFNFFSIRLYIRRNVVHPDLYQLLFIQNYL